MSEESLLRVCGEEFPSKNLSEKITMNSIKGHLVSQGRRSHPTTRIRGEPTCFSKSGVSAPLIQGFFLMQSLKFEVSLLFFGKHWTLSLKTQVSSPKPGFPHPAGSLWGKSSGMGCLAFQHLVGLNVNNSFLYQVFCPTKDLTWRTCEFVLMELHSKSICACMYYYQAHG